MPAREQEDLAPLRRDLDVRPLLAAGEEPFGTIMEASAGVPIGGVLRLTAPFEPVPLYRVMATRGFAHRGRALGGGDFEVEFLRTGITPESTVAEVHEAHPATAPVIAAHGFDLCCGGGRTLSFVCQAHGVELEPLMAELQEAALEGGGS